MYRLKYFAEQTLAKRPKFRMTAFVELVIHKILALLVFASKVLYIQSTLVISNLKGPSETLRDIRSSTYQMFRIEENTNCTTKFNK